MEPLVKALEEVGYRNGKNLFGAPYNFRYGLAADGLGLIESASNSNGGKPVILVSHSLGGTVMRMLTFASGNTLVREEQRSSETHDIPEFLKDIGFPEGVLPYTSHILPLVYNLVTSTDAYHLCNWLWA
ncbi:hypothetical protein H5410_022696 [Solanum commersonii]|uniref:Uncharacterized protein n=1 Tax=Solanum commersonii TaxID=4109 RepID=A0A9J5ZHI8_SOLCO|nr:hypothetical protein H5410_022696 [Solanum commersonii]